jgi:hypothetical protein
MKDEAQHWVWAFGDISGLRWVLDQRVMAFTTAASAHLRGMAKGDRAVLYVTRGAYHNPTKDASKLAGLVTVLDTPMLGAPVVIGGREFPWSVPILADLVLPERQGPEVLPLVSRLSFVGNRSAWGQYFRTSPKRISLSDFEVLAAAIARQHEDLSEGDPT